MFQLSLEWQLVECFGAAKDNMIGGGGGGELKYQIKLGVLVVSLRGVNFRFWSRLGC